MMPQKPSKRAIKKKHNTSSINRSEYPEALYIRAQNNKLLASRNYPIYISSLLRDSQFYRLVSHYLNIFRKFRLVSLLFRLYSYLLILLQLGTAFVILVIGVLILLPVLLLSTLCLILSALLLYRKENKRMEQLLSDKKITVFFPTRDGEFESGHFWKAHIEELAERPHAAILVVSPFFWSGKGLDENRFYFLLREEKKNVYLLRKHYYFSLRQNILKHKHDSLTIVY